MKGENKLSSQAISTPKQKKRRHIFIKLLYGMLVLLVLLSTATYTWFSLSKTPKVNDMAVFVNSSVGLQISWELSDDEEAWGWHLDYNKKFTQNSTLKPVTYSDINKTFYATNFGLDGRIASISKELNDAQNANREDAEGYYVAFTVYARTDEDVEVELSKNIENSGTYLVGTPVWNDEEIIHNNGGKGAQSAMRIGFRVTRFDPDGKQIDEEPLFIIYEPNCDNHLDYTTDYEPTPSMDGTESLVPADRLIRQESTAWLETNPVQKGVVVFDYGEFLDDNHLFDLDKNCTAKIDIYIWLEGQDVDCTNEIGKEAMMLANVQFHAERKPDTGLEEDEIK